MPLRREQRAAHVRTVPARQRLGHGDDPVDVREHRGRHFRGHARAQRPCFRGADGRALLTHRGVDSSALPLRYCE